MDYLTLNEAAEYATRVKGFLVKPETLLRAGVYRALLIAATFNSSMRNLTNHEDEEYVGALVLAAGDLMTIENEGQTVIKVAFGLDGKNAYSPHVNRTLAQLRVMVLHLDEFLPLLEPLETQHKALPPTVLFNDLLVQREYESHLLSVRKLTAWAQNKGLELVTLPVIDAYQFVQVEALLCAIERASFENSSEPMAAAMVQKTPRLKDSPAAEFGTQRWLAGADAHVQWRGLLKDAIKAGELELLDFNSKLPIEVAASTVPAPAQASAQPQAETQLADSAHGVSESASSPSRWTVKEPQRFKGYGAPLYRLITAAHKKGEPRPTARYVVEAWRNERPAEIAQVLSEGFDYYDANGNTVGVDLEGIRKAIARMTKA